MKKSLALARLPLLYAPACERVNACWLTPLQGDGGDDDDGVDDGDGGDDGEESLTSSKIMGKEKGCSLARRERKCLSAWM